MRPGGGRALCPLGARRDARAARWDALTAGLVLFVALPGSALAYWAVAVVSRFVPAVTTSLGLLATPVVGIAVSAAALGESLTVSLLVAVAMILGGIAIGTTGRAPTGRAAATRRAKSAGLRASAGPRRPGATKR